MGSLRLVELVTAKLNMLWVFCCSTALYSIVVHLSPKGALWGDAAPPSFSSYGTITWTHPSWKTTCPKQNPNEIFLQELCFPNIILRKGQVLKVAIPKAPSWPTLWTPNLPVSCCFYIVFRVLGVIIQGPSWRRQHQRRKPRQILRPTLDYVVCVCLTKSGSKCLIKLRWLKVA